ncbi:uncharacterized protein [Mytilus edulis]|uniref:uncharacterized protein n=1 Tax=Mytilus edulis TaxID=6550 RepID=UPI0039EE295E
MQGKVVLPVIKDPSHSLQNLFILNTEQAKHFRINIRAYNSSLAFASLGVHEDVLPHNGPYNFRICGFVHHRIGHLFPSEGKAPKFAQIYIPDTENELCNRMQWNDTLNKSVLLTLQNMLQDCNPFIDIFKNAAKIMHDDHNASHQNIKLVLHADTSKDTRRYNLPTASEVSLIIPGSQMKEPTNRDIVLYKNSSNHPKGYDIIHITETHPKYDPLHYVLFLPYGHSGWTIDSGNTNSHSGNANSHNDLRAELYQELNDAVHAGDVDGVTVDRKIILPSSFTGSPRNMYEQYQDAMSIHMIHGPCGKANKQSPCMNDGKCSKGFPKDFNPATLQTSDGYPLYKRRDDGLCVEKNGVILDNRWVVPYNPHLCTKYSAHINVEICSAVKAVKYLYKYVYKGHDKIMVGLQKAETSDSDQKSTNVYNEITHYVDARYVSASEACWRIFHYDLHTHSPAIQRLAVHLPGQEQVIYSEGKAQQALQHNKNTTLTGATCYEDLRKFEDGTVCTTFKETAMRRGFLQHDEEWVECLTEAAAIATPTQIHQHHVYQKVVDATEHHTNTTAYYVDGPGGSGKTFLYNTILARIRSKGKIALAVASAGIAAELLEGGRTAHSRFKIPIPISETSTCNISRNSALANLIKNTANIVWDEAPMIHKHVLECVHRTLCDITQIDKPFGGKVVLLGGDFRQVLPVIRHETQAEIINSNIMQSFLLESITMFNLTINMRVRSNAHSNNQADFENFLLRIESSHYSKFTDRAILTTTNDDVDTINTMVMDMFPSTVSKTYLSPDTVEDESTGYLYPTEFLNAITPSGTPPHKLTLKKHAPIILLRILNPAA